MRKTNTDPKVFTQVRRMVLFELNKFLKHVARESLKSDFQVASSKAERNR